MFVCERDARVNKRALRKLWTSLLRCSLEGELREGGIGCIVGYGGIIDVDGRVVDRGYDEIANSGIVLAGLVHASADKMRRRTRPPLCSTHMVPLRSSMQSWPETTGRIFDWTLRRPGPIFIVEFLG